jgi:hypothetical protein
MSTYSKDLALDACYGANKAAGWPATVYLAFFNGDPTAAGTELTGTGGVARTALANNGTNFGAAAGGIKNNAAQWSTGVSSGAWTDPADHWAFYDALTGGNLLDSGQLVDGGGTATTVAVTAANQIIVIPVGDFALTQS